MDPIFDNPKRYGYTIPADAKEFFYARPHGKANIFLRDDPDNSEQTSPAYPFIMTTGRVLEQWHTGSMTMRIPETAAAHPHSFVEINEKDANRLKIKNGDIVKVESIRGSNILPAKIVNNTLEGVIFVPMHDQKADRMVNFICSDIVDPTSAEPDYKVSAVKITKVSGPKKIDGRYLVTRTEMNKKTFS